MPFDIIIPAAGRGQRLGSKSPKGLISLGNETILQRQIRLLKAAYPESRIIVVGGHKHDKLYRTLPEGTGFVFNKDYEQCNVSHSIRVGLEHVKPENAALIVYGDLVFNSQALPNSWPETSAVVVDDSNLRDGEVGVSEGVSHSAIQFAFGLPIKWSHIVMLQPKEKALFLQGSSAAHRFRYFGYELLNHILANGGGFKLVRPPGMKLVEIDTSSDIPKAEELVNEDSV